MSQYTTVTIMYTLSGVSGNHDNGPVIYWPYPYESIATSIETVVGVIGVDSTAPRRSSVWNAATQLYILASTSGVAPSLSAA